MTKIEAENKAIESRPNFEIIETIELEKCFVVSTQPKGYNVEEDGMFVGGAVRVDKNTGKCSLFNPVEEGVY